MGPPTSQYFAVCSIPGAGRGVIASRAIAADTLILQSQEPAAHVIFRQYRKEVCAYCFAYDRGRTLAVRDSDTGKVFCAEACRDGWREAQTALGVEAWRSLQRYLQSKSKAMVNNASMAQPVAGKPGKDRTDAAWGTAERQAQALLSRADDKTIKKQPSTQAWNRTVDAEVLGFLLSGILFHHHHPVEWQEDVLSLVMDEEPYKTPAELDAHCSSYIQLRSILPEDLISSCTPSICRTLANASSHNAFGIRSGSEDGEEYMGYGTYPSASYFNHSCSPNLLKRRVGSSWEFRAGRDLEAGEECCITYMGGDEKEMTVAERRSRLQDYWEFRCMCPRCQREAEL